MQKNLTQAWSEMFERLNGWLETMITNLPNIVLGILVFVVFIWISRKVQWLIRKPLRKFVDDDSVKHLIIRFTAVVVIALGLLLTLGILNLNTALKSLLAGAGVAGLAVGLALQGTLSNTVAGIALSLKKVINIGDWIVTNGYAGRVEKITLRNTSILERDNNIVVIPNNKILDNPFKNYSLTDRIRTIVHCGIGYEEDLHRVKEIAVKAIEERFPQEHHEEIEFFYEEFGSSSINFVVRFWVEAKENLTILGAKSEAIMTLKDTFDENNINIPFPIRTLEMRNKDQFKEVLHTDNKN